MASAAARTVLGEASEICDVRFEQMLLLDDETAVGAVATVKSPGVVAFEVETYDDGEHVRRATAVLRAVAETRTSRPRRTWPTCWRRIRARWRAPTFGNG